MEDWHLRFGITSNCNFRCSYCNSHNSVSKDMSDKDIKEIIEAAKNNGVKRIHWTGGEPLFKNSICEFMKYAKELGYEEQSMTTNGFFLEKKVEELKDSGISRINISLDTMPNEDEERGCISSVEPTGWINKKYDSVDGGYLYNRCHLIGYQLSAENANEKNLITGTRYMNTEGMLPFENQIADYVKETRNHVLYRVTPIFEGDNLVASGVELEAMSVEDDGEGICFNVYCYNNQPGITIDYSTGESKENA